MSGKEIPVLDINEKDNELEINEELSEETEVNEENVQQEEKEPVLCFEYNVLNEEEEKAFLIFQKKYVYRHNWKVTIAFAIVAALFGVSVIRNPNGYLNWVLMVICLVMIFVTWFNTRRIRKYLVSALKTLEDDKYIFTLYDDSFKIETVFTEEEKEEEDFVPVPPRIVNFDDISLNVIENSEMFIIILKKETIYVLSKRVMDEDQQKILRERFSEILGEDFERRED